LSQSALPSDLRREVRLLVQEEIQSAEKELVEKIRENLAPEIIAVLSQQAEGSDSQSHRLKNQGRKS